MEHAGWAKLSKADCPSRGISPDARIDAVIATPRIISAPGRADAEANRMLSRATREPWSL